VSFVAHSTVATGVVAARTMLAPLLLGAVAGSTQVGLFRIAQAPQTGLIALSSPVRLVQLTEQTASWEGGERRGVLAQLRRYMVGATVLMAVVIPIFLVLMPWLIDVVFGTEYADATTAARIVLFAGALQFVFAWSKTLPVSIGRPNLRVITHGVEAVVLLVLVVVLGSRWGVTGAAGAVLASTSVFACCWALLLARLHLEVRDSPAGAAVAR
jgi:O-antigen/teichoic acid export membrane protein